MSALGQKQTLQHVRAMSALPPKADIGDPARVSPSTQQLRQPGDIRRNPPRLVEPGVLTAFDAGRLFTGYSQAKPAILFLLAGRGWLWQWQHALSFPSPSSP